MKRAIGLIAATLVSASVYSQEYSGSSSQNPDSTPADYQSRQTEAGAPASSESSSASSSGYEVAPGTGGGNSLTGQSSGANVNVHSDDSTDKALTTRDSDVTGSEYRGTADSGSSDTLKGSGSADGAFHEPASPVREGSKSEGWSGSGTFSGAGPGTVNGSASATSTPPAAPSSNNFKADLSGNTALENRDQDLSDRGLQPDSKALSSDDVFDRIDRDINDDGTVVFEDWTIVEPDTNIGGPAGSDTGSSSSSSAELNSNSDSSSAYNDELYQRVQRDWSARTGNTDVPATPGVMDHEMDQLRLYNSRTVEPSDVGAPASGESGAKTSTHEKKCDVDKGSSDKSASSDYHINRGKDESYHINRSESASVESSAPGEYGDRATSENYDDGHLKGNNAAGSSATSESGSTSSSEEGALNQPDL